MIYQQKEKNTKEESFRLKYIKEFFFDIFILKHWYNKRLLTLPPLPPNHIIYWVGNGRWQSNKNKYDCRKRSKTNLLQKVFPPLSFRDFSSLILVLGYLCKCHKIKINSWAHKRASWIQQLERNFLLNCFESFISNVK
jgi:hypothetical protein